MKRIDLARKIRICDVITQIIYLQCDVIRHLPVQTWYVYYSLSVQPLSATCIARGLDKKHKDTTINCIGTDF